MTRVNLRIRPATRLDVPAIVRLLDSIDLSAGTFSGLPVRDASPEHLAERFAEILETDRVLLVAADEAGAVEGLLGGRFDDVGAIDLTPVLHVSHLIVSPEHRRRGIGRSLLAAAVHLADERGVEHVVVTAMSGARESNRYLARLGFAPLVVHRMAPTAALRRTLGMTEVPNRVAVLRRARLLRAQRASFSARGVGRGA